MKVNVSRNRLSMVCTVYYLHLDSDLLSQHFEVSLTRNNTTIIIALYFTLLELLAVLLILSVNMFNINKKNSVTKSSVL